jgi:hypothetical protein
VGEVGVESDENIQQGERMATWALRTCLLQPGLVVDLKYHMFGDLPHFVCWGGSVPGWRRKSCWCRFPALTKTGVQLSNNDDHFSNSGCKGHDQMEIWRYPTPNIHYYYSSGSQQGIQPDRPVATPPQFPIAATDRTTSPALDLLLDSQFAPAC